MSLATTQPDSVTVLLSTYNGHRYLKQQLDSLYGQTYANLRILVRDDGSSDATINMLEVEQAKGTIDLLTERKNLGPALSFFTLLKQASITDTALVAFCDQDDVWQPEKITRAVAALQGVSAHHPAMYCCRIEMVDEQLNRVAMGEVPRKIGFGNALVENIATGCTIVLNRAAIDLLSAGVPDNAQMHDWWCYLVMSCFGEVIFDPVALIKYRLHDHNTIGVATKFTARFARKLHRFFGKQKQKAWCSDHAYALREIYGDKIPIQNKQLVDRFIAAKSSFFPRVGLVFSGDLWRQKFDDNFFLRILLLINKI